MILAAIVFAFGAIFQAFDGPDLNKAGAWAFWLLAGLAVACLESWHPLIRKR